MTAKTMQEQRFIDHVYDGYHAGERYCFILGAGASRSSGIRTGEELMREWHAFLLERGEAYIRESAEDAGHEEKEYVHLLRPDVKLSNKDYFTLFDLRFAGQASAAYNALEKEMDGKQPGFGYYPLSMLLTKTENKLVITTNFDSLTEDAIFIYTHKHPLVVGHESLAGFMGNNVRRPVIAKVHRDLFFSPMNRNKDMQALADGWEKPLGNALQKYIPIVIGYAGGDRTLMTLLSKIQLKNIYWCYVGQKPDEDICGVVEKNRGYLVKILGFDEIMFQLAERFAQEISFDDPRDGIIDQAEQRCKNYQESFDRIKETYAKNKSDKEQKYILQLSKALNQFESRRYEEKALNKKLEEISSYIKQGANRTAIRKCSHLIERYPHMAKLYHLRSIAYHNIGEYKSDWKDISTVIKLDPTKASYYYSRAVTLHKMEQYKNALVDENKIIEMEPRNARYFYQRSITLFMLKQYKKALLDISRAIELEPDNAEYYKSRSITLRAMGEIEKAECDEKKAEELCSNKVQYSSARKNR